jgi:NAD(P)-dependent dehydrogenase (short-subunit alcohol dehydrogenase family)
MKELKGRVAVITGAASGIGLAFAERFARESMKLVLADIEATRLDEVTAGFKARNTPVVSLRVDVADPDNVEALARLTYESYGAAHLLCNNAGVVPAGRFRPVWEYPLEDWNWAFDVNMMGVVNGIRSFIPRMLKAGEEGHVVNTASIAGLISGAQTPVYSAAKTAVVRISEALYASLNDMGAKIGVTTLCPGVVQTRIYESERNRPKDLVPAAGIHEESSEMHQAMLKIRPGGLGPDGVADMVHDAVINNRFYCLTTDAFDEQIRHRLDSVLARRNPEFANLLSLTQKETSERLKKV